MSASWLAAIAQQGAPGAADYVLTIFALAVYLAISVVGLAGLWTTFTKAGQPGWAAIVPFYNLYVMCKIAGRPGWWVVLMLLPIVSLIVFLIVCIEIAQRFGKGVGFGLGLGFLGIVFFPILGFGSARYTDPAGGSGGPGRRVAREG